MQKVNEISAALNKEVGHYCAVAKSINVPRRQSTGALLAQVFFFKREYLLRYFCCGPSCHDPVRRCQWGFRSLFFRADNRQQKACFQDQETPRDCHACHRKRDTVDRLLSKALADKQISDSEFQLIMVEYSQYNALKEANLTRQSSRPDVEKIKKDVCSEMEADFKKKIKCSRRRFKLTYQKFNSDFHFSVTKSHA